jgi:hypothetical protein
MSHKMDLLLDIVIPPWEIISRKSFKREKVIKYSNVFLTYRIVVLYSLQGPFHTYYLSSSSQPFRVGGSIFPPYIINEEMGLERWCNFFKFKLK